MILKNDKTKLILSKNSKTKKCGWSIHSCMQYCLVPECS